MSDDLVQRLREYTADDATRFRGKSMTDEAADRIEALAAEVTRLTDALATVTAERDKLFGLLTDWQSYGCPACGGDCSAANPPVIGCLMQETAAALQPRAEAAENPRADRWQPIETAPKDGTPIDIWLPSVGRITNVVRSDVYFSAAILALIPAPREGGDT